MILKFLLKIWPALLPILIYCLWILVQKIIYKFFAKKAGKIIDATYEEVNNKEEKKQNPTDKAGNFSLHNRQFIMILYLSFFIAIICFLFFAIRVPKIENGKYVPAHIENGKIIPGEIIK